ncbi:MAG: hypothetical protein ACFFCT_12010 [Candidatus Odinarchaeota archaeon]
MTQEELQIILKAITLLENFDPRITTIYGTKRSLSINLNFSIEEYQEAIKEHDLESA